MPSDFPFPLIKTQRMVLRHYEPALAPLIQQYHVDNQNFLYRWDPADMREKITPEFWKLRCHEAVEVFQKKKSIQLLALNPEETKMWGGVNIRNVQFKPVWCGELGFSVAEAQEGKGIAFEMVTAAIDYAFEVFNLHRLMASHDVDNPRSGKLLSRLGFSKEAYFAKILYTHGEWRDHIHYSLINENWKTED